MAVSDDIWKVERIGFFPISIEKISAKSVKVRLQV